MKHSIIKDQLNPDLIIQIGSALISTEIQDMISQSMRKDSRLSHVLLHSHRPTERVDAAGTVTHKITSDVASFLPKVIQILETEGFSEGSLGSQLAPLLYLGRAVAKHMPLIIHEATSKVKYDKRRVWNNSMEDETVTLSEPEIVLAISEILCDKKRQYHQDLFLSNSMPVRDSEFFLYPINDYIESTKGGNECLGISCCE